MNCSVVVPVYQSGQTLGLLIERLGKELPKIAKKYEVILVNDGSRDDSWDVIVNLAKKKRWVRGINLMRNYGQHNATLCGIRASQYEIVFTMDDDLQNPPEEMGKLLAKINEGFDVVYGVANKRSQGWFKSIVAFLLKRAISYVMGQKNVGDISALRAIRKDLTRSFDSFAGPDILVDVLLSWGTSRFASVPVEEAPRAAGHSNYNLWKLIQVSFLVLTSYTTAPLRLASVLGFFFTAFGFFILIYVLVLYFTVGSIDGFPFLASSISIFSGAQLFALGIMGEYLARLFERSSGKLPYVIKQTTDKA